MSHKPNKKLHPYCLNCHYPLSEFDKNCSQCGQKPTDGKTTLHDLLHEIVHTLFHLDGKFFWTLKHLFVPGKLTQEFFKGHHKRYAHPVQLFLVLGALAFGTIVSRTHKAEEKINKSIEENKKSIYREQMLEELKKTHFELAPQYSASQKRILDSAFVRFKNQEWGDSSKRITQVTINEAGISFSSKNDGKKAEKDDGKDAENLKNADISNTDSSNTETDTIEPSTVKDFVKDFKGGIKEGQKEDKEGKNQLNTQVENIVKEAVNGKGNVSTDPYHIKKDSSQLFSFINWGGNEGYSKIRISKQELYEGDEDFIIQKYKIEGFWNILHAKQNLKIKKNGDDLFHQFMSKLIWVTLFLVPVLALVFLVLYRRQKKYYVEHVVFLLHYNTTLFVGIILMFLIFPLWHGVAGLFFIWAALHFFLSIKFYYQQGKRKTFLKYLIITFSYFILAMIAFVLSLLISFFLF
jgi:Protein of unknown function (DUF3667)